MSWSVTLVSDASTCKHMQHRFSPVSCPDRQAHDVINWYFEALICVPTALLPYPLWLHTHTPTHSLQTTPASPTSPPWHAHDACQDRHGALVSADQDVRCLLEHWGFDCDGKKHSPLFLQSEDPPSNPWNYWWVGCGRHDGEERIASEGGCCF